VGSPTEMAAASADATVAEPADVSATPMAEPAVPTPAVATDVFAGLDPTLLLSLLLPLLLAVYFLFGRRSSAGGRKLLLFGPVGSGKTALYHRLKHGRVPPTVSSMEPASGQLMLSADNGNGGAGTPVHVCDMPGSGRLRGQLKEEAVRAAALVCVLDGTQLAAQAREAAGMLFDVYSHEAIARRPPALLVAVNKHDAVSCATPAAARKAIEQEVQRVRLARTTMEDTSGRSKALRGVADDSAGPFTFDQLGGTVTFAAISATKPNVAALVEFALKHAR